MAIRARRALVGLATVAAVLALPAVASAAITPALTLNQSSGTTAGTSPATVGFDAVFAPNPATDGVKDVTFALPPGLLANAGINGGACLVATTPTAACQAGTGTVTAGGVGVPVTEYLVAAPVGSGAAGGVAIVNNATQQSVTTGAVSLGATGLNVAFTNLPAALDISEMNFTLTDLRLPTSCPSPAANVTMTADSQSDSTTKTTTAPLNVSGCSGLPYAPTLSASETKDPKDNGATLAFLITQAANEAASKTIALKLPGGLGINLSADVSCLTGSGSGCTVGTATATSPLVPSAALAKGTVSLGGTAAAPTITIAFPAPFAITLVGDVNIGSSTVTINNVPDLPLTSLNLNLTGPNGQKAFTTSCTPSTTTGTFTSQGDVAKSVTANVTLNNCPAVSGSLSGLAAGHPKLRLKATHGKGGANIASVAVGLPGGLKFSRSAFVTHKTCGTNKGKKTCTTVTQIKGLGVSGASAKSVALRGGKLVITLKKAAGTVSVSLNGPVLTETKALQTGVKKKKVKSLTVTLNVTDAAHGTTSLPLKLAAH